MKKLATIGFFLSLVSMLGCAAEFDPGSRVDSYRVLAQQTDVPFAQPGETVNVSSLSFDPQGRSVTWAWGVCVNPDASTVEGCMNEIAEGAAATGSTGILAQGPGLSSFSYTVPADAISSLPEKAKGSAMVGILSIACPGDLSFEQASSTLPFSCKEAGTGRVFGLDEFIVGLKRVQVRATDRNKNPQIEQVLFDGADWPESEVKQVIACDTDNNDYKPCAEETKHAISARPTADSVESGRSEFGIDFSEQVIIQYFSTAGTFEDEVKIAEDPETHFVARKADSGKDLTLWMVVHDDRGGATWTERHVHVQ
jgi:hypothetical protein